MPDWFEPTTKRLLCATAIAFIGFLLPQEAPLEWYPLNHPGDDILYLQITCFADKSGEVRIFYDATRGFNEIESIRFPISPTAQAYTYIFPLPDAPITGLRLDPAILGGSLIIHQMRIIDRRESEIRRFTRDSFIHPNQIAAVTKTSDGWMITPLPNAKDPHLDIDLPSPILAHGLNGRNLQRCLLSTGYLALMLAILLLAVLFTFYRPGTKRDLFARLGYVAVLALLFAAVGNRGLIRNSIHSARYTPPVGAFQGKTP